MYVYLATVGYELQANKKVDPLHHRFNKKAVNKLFIFLFSSRCDEVNHLKKE